MRPRVFLSYTREDREAVEDVYRRLKAAGYQPWMDIENLRAGDDWDATIRQALSEVDYVLVFLSSASVNRRGYIQKEMRLSLEAMAELPAGHIFLIPIRLEECEIPKPLSQLHVLDLYRPNGWERLLTTLHHRSQDFGTPSDITHAVEAERSRERHRKHAFVAMPFSKEMEDTFHYGIQRAVDANDMTCLRMDKDAFMGDILLHVKQKIETAAVVIADLSGANPNVYLEVGYAWGKGIPSVLLVKDASHLLFDVRGQRCLVYDSIYVLEEALTSELAKLRTRGLI